MIKPSNLQTLPVDFETSSSIKAFLLRNNLEPQALDRCFKFISSYYPESNIAPISTQGFCSITFILTSSSPTRQLILQFRPSSYTLNLDIVSLASRIYPTYAPTTIFLGNLEDDGGSQGGLLVYEMSLTPGISLQSLRVKFPEESQDLILLEQLVKDFATFQIASHHTAKTSPPPEDLGPVGSTLSTRLSELHTHLPPRFRPKTRLLLDNLKDITGGLPWVLTHGDLLSGNIMLESRTGHLTGLVDWAESEILPFGISLYGLEEILGALHPNSDKQIGPGDGKKLEFLYHPQTPRLRSLFWDTLQDGIPALKDKNGEVRKRVELARDLGVLLWFGIAFDGGAIDRVVQEGRDGDSDDIIRLDAFLGTARAGESSRAVEEIDLGIGPKL